MSSVSQAAGAAPPTPIIPAKFLAHLGITEGDLEAIAAQGLTLEEAVATGVLRLPPEIKPAEFPGYLRDLAMYVEMDRVPEDSWWDQPVFEGTAKEATLLGLIDDPCRASN